MRDLGFDAAFNYHDGPVTDLLGQAAPDGIDVYYDNVGGDHLEAAINHLNTDGRVAMCGAISQYNSVEPPCAPRNLGLAIGKRLTLRGFVIAKYAEEVRPEFQQKMAQWLANDEIHWDETYRDGLDAAPKAFIDARGCQHREDARETVRFPGTEAHRFGRLSTSSCRSRSRYITIPFVSARE